MTHPIFSDVYAELARNELSTASVRRVFEAIFAGAWTPVQVGAFIASLRLRGESAETIAAAAEAMQSAMIPVEHDHPIVLDTCGTGGDGHGTLNLSTGAAIIAAAAVIIVAKHGNRAISSKAGSADVIEAMGVPIDLPASAAAGVLRKAGIAFMLAPTHHPAMRHAAQARRELGIRTIFNCLGPLVNPARATHQLVGAYDDALRPVMASTLKALGARRAWVVRGLDGLDEVSPHGVTRVTELASGTISELEITPEDFGLPQSDRSAVAGGDAQSNAAALETILSGKPHPAATAVVLNAAAALVVGAELEPKAAADRARQIVESGAALRTLQAWRAAARAHSDQPSS